MGGKFLISENLKQKISKRLDEPKQSFYVLDE